MDGFTGINATEIKDSVYKIYGCFDIAKDRVRESALNFLSNLSHCWFSQRAIDFKNTFLQKYIEVIDALDCGRAQMVGNVVDTANIWLGRNGWPKIDIDFDVFTDKSNPHTCLYDVPMQLVSADNGTVGMDKVRIAEEIIPYIENWKIQISEQLDGLYYFIGLYDPNGEQLAAYDRLRSTITTKINSIVSEITALIKNAMDEEISINDTTMSDAATTIENNKVA